MVDEQGLGQEVLRISDPDLPSLASEAAVELDNLAMGHRVELEAVKRLGRLLGNSFSSAHQGPGQRGVVDAATLAVVGEAFTRSAAEGPPHTIDVIIARATSIANNMSSESLTKDAHALEWTRAFCVSLSQCAAAYRKSIYDLRPSHPFRR